MILMTREDLHEEGITKVQGTIIHAIGNVQSVIFRLAVDALDAASAGAHRPQDAPFESVPVTVAQCHHAVKQSCPMMSSPSNFACVHAFLLIRPLSSVPVAKLEKFQTHMARLRAGTGSRMTHFLVIVPSSLASTQEFATYRS